MFLVGFDLLSIFYHIMDSLSIVLLKKFTDEQDLFFVAKKNPGLKNWG